ncbi:MAG: neutral/alkaline non-lysosomal ceramidase N-terminal domain-containing protein [candidate division Zixibacteria bacterium]|nr:neutral/alkaline non-lysosomal ceramidase N-terminal domain-containing protein [candidate division Zixibacteria bacterium]
MRNVSLLATVVITFVSLLCPVARGGEAGERPWSVGYAEADITPAPGQVQMRGFGRERYAKGALAPLLTQVVALRDRDGHAGVLITADIAGFERVMTEAIRRAITRKHGIPAEDVMLAASHTHWGPAAQFHATFAAGGPNVWYMGFMEDKILANVDAALKDLSPATIEYGSIDFRGIGCNRRLPRNGEITWGPYPEGSFDGHTPILRIKREQSPRQLMVVGHACHPTSSGKIEKWSPDYPGAMRDYLAGQLPDTKGVFIQGCGGDAKVVHKDPNTGKLVFSADPERSRQAGEKLARAVLAHLEKGWMVPLAGQLACSLATGQLSYGKRWTREEIEREAYTGSKKRYYTWVARQSLAMPDHSQSFRYDVQVWKLGNRLTIFGMEGEVCSPWGPMLRSMARTEQALVIGYVNNVDAYIPDKRVVREGGYEGGDAQKFFLPGPFTENIDSEIKQIVDRAIDAVK